MKISLIKLTCTLVLATGTVAFQFPGGKNHQPKVILPQAKSIEEPTRRSFLQSAGVMVASSFLTPAKSNALQVGGKVRYGDESIMSPKAHGTSEKPVQTDLLYGVSNKLADKITNFNRHFAEMGGYFRSTNFEDVVLQSKGPVTFYDSVTGKPLFVAPIGRSADEFLRESEIHGWPSFRDEEVSLHVVR